jgi:transcriptional regulator with XRE-family HTH domain
MDNARTAVADLGARLALVRDLRGLTGPQVERITDYSIDRSALSRIESGKRVDPHLSTLLVLAVAYDADFLISRRGHVEIRGTNLSKLAEAKLKGDT